jgi:PAS domain S-box-containing protein
MREMLRKSVASLAEAQRIAHLGNWDWDIVNNELRWSDEIYRIFGLIPQQFGATYEAFLNSVHPDDREFVKEAVNKSLYENEPYSIDHRIVLPDGSERIVHEQAEVFFDNAGKPIRMMGTVQDVTERKRIEEERQRLQESKSRFVSAATHELKTPLAAIKGYADLLSLGTLGEIPQSVRDGLKVVSRNTDRLLHLIGELLDIQRMEDGRLKLNVEAVNLAEAAKQTIQDMTPIINSKKLQLELLLPEADLNVPGDKIRLQEIMDNLLSNAIKYTPENGKIKITVTEETDQLRVSVLDTGIGISPEYLPHVFDPFSKIPKARYTGDYGTFGIYETGLGLNVTKHLVEMHGGKIWAESEGEGKGSTFTFTIPRKVKKFEK